MAAYEQRDYDKVASFYTDESTFQDLAYASIQEINGVKGEEGASCAAVPKGQAAIKEKLKKSMAEVKDIKFATKSKFYVGRFAVHTLTVTATIPLKDLPDMTANVDMVLVLEIKNNKVVNHFSLTDIETVSRLMAQHQRTYTATN